MEIAGVPVATAGSFLVLVFAEGVLAIALLGKLRRARRAQAVLWQCHAELERRVLDQATTIQLANDILRAEIGHRVRMQKSFTEAHAAVRAPHVCYFT